MPIVDEFLKLRTIRSPWLLLAVAQVVIVAGVAGAYTTGDRPDADLARTGVAHLGLVALFSLVLGIMAVAGEHRCDGDDAGHPGIVSCGARSGPTRC